MVVHNDCSFLASANKYQTHFKYCKCNHLLQNIDDKNKSNISNVYFTILDCIDIEVLVLTEGNDG